MIVSSKDSSEHLIAAQHGAGFLLKEGEILRVKDFVGGQVADFYCFAMDNPSDDLSAGRSIDYNESILFTTGSTLYSVSGRPMIRVGKDTCGRHDFLVTPCSQQMFSMMSQNNDYHPSCLENLERAFESLHLAPLNIGTTFNIFMNVQFDSTGKISVETPLSKAGDTLELLALMDLYVGLTACSDEGSNGGTCKPVGYSVLDQSSSTPE